MSDIEEIETPTQEIDVPPDDVEESNIETGINQKELEERNAERKEKRYLTYASKKSPTSKVGDELRPSSCIYLIFLLSS